MNKALLLFALAASLLFVGCPQEDPSKKGGTGAAPDATGAAEPGAAGGNDVEGDGVVAGGVVGRIADLAHDNQQIRWAAARGLGQLGPEAASAAPALVEVLEDDPAFEVRASAAEALGKLGPSVKEQAVPALKQAATDDDKLEVRQAAAKALAAFEG